MSPAQSEDFSVVWNFDITDTSYDPNRYATMLAALVPGLNASDIIVTRSAESGSGVGNGSGVDGYRSVEVTVKTPTANAAFSALHTFAALSAAEVATQVEATGPVQLLTTPTFSSQIVDGPAKPPPPSPPLPFAPAPEGLLWVGTLTFDVLILARRRRLATVSDGQISTAVAGILAENGLQLGDETLLVSATAATNDTDGSQRFTLTVVAVGAYMQRIDEIVRKLDFRTQLGAKLGTAINEVSILNITFALAGPPAPSVPSPSPPPQSQSTLVDNLDGRADAITAGDNSDDNYLILAIVLLVLLCLCGVFPFCCCFYARWRYGAGKDKIWLRYRTTHSNPRIPFRYVSGEHRERIRKEVLRPEERVTTNVQFSTADPETLTKVAFKQASMEACLRASTEVTLEVPTGVAAAPTAKISRSSGIASPTALSRADHPGLRL